MRVRAAKRSGDESAKVVKDAKFKEHEEASQLRALRASRPSRRFVPSWSTVYDVLYGTEAADPSTAGVNGAFLAAQLAYIRRHLPAVPARVLDAGCGTGRHVAALARLGYRAVGVDSSEEMLRRAQETLAAAEVAVGLVRADLRGLPFDGCFEAALCLESPLAYLHEDATLAGALRGLRRSLVPGAPLIMDVFDYPATLGEGQIAAVETRLPTAWGSVTVRETHRYDRERRVWHMVQAFSVAHQGHTEAFTVTHALRVRTAAEYAAAVEEAGFAVEELLPGYPGTPEALGRERRILVVAEAGR